MADLKRVFAQHNTGTDQLEWYFMAREGLEGPFENEALAEESLQRYIEYCQFDPNRVFLQANEQTGGYEWFFVARDGIEGPYASEELAKAALAALVETNQRQTT